MTDTETTQENPVAEFKERVYTRALELGRGNGYERETKVYLEELGLAPTLVFRARDGETVESLTAAVYAKLEELGHTQYADRLGLERPGTQEVTVTATFRLSPEELDNLTVAGHLPNKQPVRVNVESDAEPTEA